MSAALQTALDGLLAGTQQFFLAERQSPERDRQALEALHGRLMEITSHARDPAYERMLAYLLGGVPTEAHYPLQNVRMACVVARALSLTSDRPELFPEYVSAAYAADLGFRPGWLSTEGSHREVTGNHLSALSLPWLTPLVLRTIAGHHDPVLDPSPNQIVSITAEYLSLVYATGVDETPLTLQTPARALETMIENHRSTPEGIRLLVRTLSAFPLGSWVRLSTGVVGAVLGSNPQNPLRPSVGYFSPDAKTPSVQTWNDVSLAKEVTVHIVQEHVPSLIQQAFMNTPSLWIKGWEGTGLLSVDEIKKNFQAGSPRGPGLSELVVAKTRKVNDLLEVPPAADPSTPGDPGASAAGAAPPPRIDDRAHEIRMQHSEHEVRQIRDDWQRYADQVEQAIQHLRRGLIDSYKRENERYKATLTDLSRQQPPPPPAIPEAEARPAMPAPPSAQDAEAVRHALAERLRVAREQLHQVSQEIEPRISALETETAAVRKTLAQLREVALKSIWRTPEERAAVETWLTNLEDRVQGVERSVLDPSRRHPYSVLSVEQSAASGDGGEDQEHRIAKAYDDLMRLGRESLEARHGIDRISAAAGHMRQVLHARAPLVAAELGLQRKAAGQIPSAVVWLEKALEWQPDFWEAAGELGLCYLSLHDSRAFAALTKATTGTHDEELQRCLAAAKALLPSPT